MTKLLNDATNAGDFIVVYKINGQDVTKEQEYVDASEPAAERRELHREPGPRGSEGESVVGTDSPHAHRAVGPGYRP